MLGGKKTPAGRIDTLVGRNTVITGDLRFSGGLHVDGTVQGNVSAEAGTDSVLSLSQHGLIKGEVRVPNVMINGTVEGDIHAETRLDLGAEARVNGDVYYSLIEMAVGAAVNGKMLHKPAGQVPKLTHQSSAAPAANKPTGTGL
ncbi:MAG TPA: polymer-forming cytoskeletal protein [Gammaproteobacteria bacterium]|nr:polymer-forming cytoskeletal protein [Gammaproteobacteria bacterium]